jgi:molybdenum cofactor cytidylyltransferase
MEFGVAILGAGESRRMGRSKLLLPWQGTTVLAHMVRQWRELEAAQIAVVVHPHRNDISSVLEELGLDSRKMPTNEEPAGDMFASVQAAARWRSWESALTHVVLSLGDQPHLQRKTLEQLMNCARKSQHSGRIHQPSRSGRPRHPIVFPRPIFEELGNHSGPTLREFLEERKTVRSLWEMDDDGLDLDLDEPADYERALRISVS